MLGQIEGPISYPLDMLGQIKEPISPGVGVTKPIFSVPLFSQFFRIMKTVVTLKIPSSYLAGVSAAELRRHLANMNMIENI